MVSLLTDYGLSDGFVGALHSVLRRAAPYIPIVDLTHEIAREDVRGGSLALARAAPYVAAGVVVAVVDPGVGTSRRSIALRAAGGPAPGVVLVGPDNGLLVPALEVLGGPEACVELEDRGNWLASPGPTFAGRDVFAPVAARVVGGDRLEDLGRSIHPETLVRLPAPVVRRPEEGVLEAEVTWIDRFGNVQLAAKPGDLRDVKHVDVLRPALHGGTVEARVVRAFAELDAGELGLLVDSYGQLALCLNGASAAKRLGASEADLIRLRDWGEPGANLV